MYLHSLSHQTQSCSWNVRCIPVTCQCKCCLHNRKINYCHMDLHSQKRKTICKSFETWILVMFSAGGNEPFLFVFHGWRLCQIKHNECMSPHGYETYKTLRTSWQLFRSFYFLNTDFGLFLRPKRTPEDQSNFPYVGIVIFFFWSKLPMIKYCMITHHVGFIPRIDNFVITFVQLHAMYVNLIHTLSPLGSIYVYYLISVQ